MAKLTTTLSTNTNSSISFVNTNFGEDTHSAGDDDVENVLFLADLGCPDIRTYFIKNSKSSHFRHPFRWFIVDSEDRLSAPLSLSDGNIPAALNSIDLLPDSEVIVAAKISKDSFYLSQIYKISPEMPWVTEEYGIWTKNCAFSITVESLEPISLRRLDLNGTKISICYVLTNNDSINHLSDLRDGHIDTITKANFPLSNQLMEFLRAEKVDKFTDTWGYMTNGSYNGMLGYLLRGDALFGGTALFMTPDRIPLVDYIARPTPTLSKFVFRQPKLSYQNNIFLLPFRATVWYSAVALVLIVLLVLLVVASWEWKRRVDDPDRPGDSSVLKPKLSDVALLTIGAACQQGSSVLLKGTLGRVVLLVLFLSFMFLYTSYSANIVALLQSSSSHIKTLEDLLNSRLSFGVDDTVYNRYYFSTATERVRKTIYETKIAPAGGKNRFMKMEDGVKNIRQGLFAFHMETGVGYKFVGRYFKEDEKCGLKEIQYLQVMDPWTAIRKHNPYKEMMKIGMRRIHEFGLQDRENSMLYAKKPQCSGRGNSFVSVTMVDCYPALLIYTYGVICSLLLLALEILAAKKRKFGCLLPERTRSTVTI